MNPTHSIVAALAAAIGVVGSGSSCMAATASAAPEGISADACSGLTGARIGDAVIDKAERVERGVARTFVERPTTVALCHVFAHISPEPGSSIRTEVWLPDDWNGKLLATGGGGFSGGLVSGSATLLAPLVARGFAAVANNAGHDGAALDWVAERPKLLDFSYRANYRATVFAKAVAARYYRAQPRRTYFTGCSNGGRDALIQAQRFPQEYDGIVSAAPANKWTGLLTSFVWQNQVVRAVGATSLEGKLGLLHDAVLKKCDALDGVRDGVLENPGTCHFDPKVLACRAGGGDDCLTSAEVGAVRQIYRGPKARDGRSIHAGMPLGSELEWKGVIAGTGQTLNDILGTPYFRYFIHGDPAWSVDRFDLDRDYAASRGRMAALIDAVDTDLRPFAHRGGKLLMWHGWIDSAIGAENSISYFQAANRRLGPLADSLRLFMAPGVRHCALGAGPSNFDMIGELDRWVESGKPPERITATKYQNDIGVLFLGQESKVVRTRPLCAYPKVAAYKGSGSTDDSANFECRQPN